MNDFNRLFPETRLRRLRKSAFSRRLVAEHRLSVDDLICPLFIIEGEQQVEPIAAMPGVSRLSIDKLLEEVKVLAGLGVPAVVLFPVIFKHFLSDILLEIQL